MQGTTKPTIKIIVTKLTCCMHPAQWADSGLALSTFPLFFLFFFFFSLPLPLSCPLVMAIPTIGKSEDGRQTGDAIASFRFSDFWLWFALIDFFLFSTQTKQDKVRQDNDKKRQDTTKKKKEKEKTRHDSTRQSQEKARQAQAPTRQAKTRLD